MVCKKCGIDIPGNVSTCPVCKSPIENTSQAAQQCGQKTVSKLAVAALITGILSFLIPIALIPIILGSIAYSSIAVSNGKQTGRGMATAGLVLGIIAIFISYPNMNILSHARDKAKQSSCASNLKQVGLSTSMYSQDYDDKLPLKANWSDSLGDYTKNPAIFKCPMDKTQSRCSYSYNNKLNGDSLTHMKNQESIQTYFDSKGGWNSSFPVSSAVPRHGDYANFAFVDGHVNAYKVRKRGLFTFLYEFPFYMPRTIDDLRLLERSKN